MPIHHPIENPPFNIVRMSHIELGVTDLAASRKFYTEMLGLVETAQVGDSIYLRCLEERNHHSFVLTKTAVPQILRLGFKVGSEADLDKLADFFAVRGEAVEWVQPHAQGRSLRTLDPMGIPLEFCFEFQQAERILQQYSLYRGVQPQRIDHFNCFSPDVQASHDFWTKELGFRLTEYTESEDAEPELWAIWLHRKGNVHDMAFTNGVGPRLHHVAVWVPTPLHIIHLCDLMSTSGYLDNMERGPGRHGISNAFFLYVRDPDGHRIEIYNSDYMTVDPDFEPMPPEPAAFSPSTPASRARCNPCSNNSLTFIVILMSDEQDAPLGTDRQPGEHHPLDHEVRQLTEDLPVLERPRLTLIRIADDVLASDLRFPIDQRILIDNRRIDRRRRDHLPLPARRKPGAAHALETGLSETLNAGRLESRHIPSESQDSAVSLITLCVWIA